jgi:hypothetical protein
MAIASVMFSAHLQLCLYVPTEDADLRKNTEITEYVARVIFLIAFLL